MSRRCCFAGKHVAPGRSGPGVTVISPRERSMMAVADLSHLATEPGRQHHALEGERGPVGVTLRAPAGAGNAEHRRLLCFAATE